MSVIIHEKFIKFLKIADNKDKLLKILQYLVKLVLLAATKRSQDLKSFATTLSLARKLGRLGNWLPAINEIICTNPKAGHTETLKLFGIVSSLGNDLLDDWIALQKAKLLVKQPYLDTLDLWSTRLWFISTSIDIHFTLQKFKIYLNIRKNRDNSQKLQSQDVDLFLTLAKQTCDWTFCFWELANLSESLNSHVPIVAGLAAASIGALRGWRKI
jgi:hypothetical protein